MRFSTPHRPAAFPVSAAGLLALLLTGCAASSGPAGTRTARVGDNNVVIARGGGGGGGQVIFKGRDNLVESSSRNSRHAPSNDQSVLIIEGNQNHLSYSEDGVVQPADQTKSQMAGRRDTTVIKANGLRQDVRVTGPNAGKKAPARHAAPQAAPVAARAEAVVYREEVVDVATDAAQAAGNYDEREVLVPALNGYVPIKEALQHYAQLVQQGQVDALYQVALIFRSSAVLAEQQKAVDYLEAAARKSHGAAALELAGLYEQGLRGWGGVVLEPNRQKARYYYLLAAQLGAQVSADKVREVQGW